MDSYVGRADVIGMQFSATSEELVVVGKDKWCLSRGDSLKALHPREKTI